MKQHPIRFGASRALQFAVCLCCTGGFASVQGDEPPVRLAPIAPRSSATGRIDPLRQDRLTEVEREELYEQVARDADYLERQAKHNPARNETLPAHPIVPVSAPDWRFAVAG